MLYKSCILESVFCTFCLLIIKNDDLQSRYNPNVYTSLKLRFSSFNSKNWQAIALASASLLKLNFKCSSTIPCQRKEQSETLFAYPQLSKRYLRSWHDFPNIMSFKITVHSRMPCNAWFLESVFCTFCLLIIKNDDLQSRYNPNVYTSLKLRFSSFNSKNWQAIALASASLLKLNFKCSSTIPCQRKEQSETLFAYPQLSKRYLRSWHDFPNIMSFKITVHSRMPCNAWFRKN